MNDLKQALKDELVTRLRATLHELEQAYRTTLAGATHEEAKPENDKDTRALEQSYLARGQAQRVEEARVKLAEVESMVVRAFGPHDPVALGALVGVNEDEKERRLFLASDGGGLGLAGDTVQVVTPASPLGRALLGKVVGDEVEVMAGGRVRSIEVVTVA